MSKHWREPFDSSRHQNQMWGEGCEAETTRDQVLDPRSVYFVRTCSFTFEFHSIAQLSTCLAYFSQKVRPSSLIPWEQLGSYGGDQTETQRWFDRLPQWLLKETKRLRVMKALQEALTAFGHTQANTAMPTDRPPADR